MIVKNQDPPTYVAVVLWNLTLSSKLAHEVRITGAWQVSYSGAWVLWLYSFREHDFDLGCNTVDHVGITSVTVLHI